MSDASGAFAEAYVTHVTASLAQFAAQEVDFVDWTGLTAGLEPHEIFELWEDVPRAPKRRQRKAPIDYKTSLFYQLYVADMMQIMEQNKPIFRLRFRVPIDAFHDLCDDVEKEIGLGIYFQRWKNEPLSQPAIPVELLVLAALRMLGSNATLDQMFEATFISANTIRAFFLEFCRWGSEVLYDRYVKAPTAEEELRENARVYGLGGHPGCIGSADGVHISMLNYVFADYNRLKNGKESYPTLSFLVFVNHTGRVMHVSNYYYGTFNDKTLCNNDPFMARLRSDPLFTNFKYRLIDKDGVWQEFKGAYVIGDGGLIDARFVMCPLLIASQADEIAWNNMLTSLRKDVECFFGRMKRRFWMLWIGVRSRNYERVEQAFRLACALMNWLHEIDGLGDDWTAFNKYKEEINSDLEHGEPLTEADLDVFKPVVVGMPEPDDDPVGPPEHDEFEALVQQVRNESSSLLRNALIEHYAEAHSRGWVGWPKRVRA